MRRRAGTEALCRGAGELIAVVVVVVVVVVAEGTMRERQK